MTTTNRTQAVKNATTHLDKAAEIMSKADGNWEKAKIHAEIGQGYAQLAVAITGSDAATS